MPLTRQLKRPYIHLSTLACASLAAVAFVGARPDAFAASCTDSDAKPSKARGWGEHCSAGAIVQAWMKSQRHRKAILTPPFRDAGIGVAMGVPTPLPTGGATFTAEFGTRGR